MDYHDFRGHVRVGALQGMGYYETTIMLKVVDMALETYACNVYVGNERLSFETTDIVEAAKWCCETFMDRFDANRFVNAHCLAIDTEYGPTNFPFSFHRNGCTIVDDNNDAWCFVFEDMCSGKKLVTVDELLEWVLSSIEM